MRSLAGSGERWFQKQPQEAALVQYKCARREVGCREAFFLVCFKAAGAIVRSAVTGKDKNWKYICMHPNTPKPETPSASSGSNRGRGVRGAWEELRFQGTKLKGQTQGRRTREGKAGSRRHPHPHFRTDAQTQGGRKPFTSQFTGAPRSSASGSRRVPSYQYLTRAGEKRPPLP